MTARLTPAALLAAACVLAAGCGGNGHRVAVSRYIEQVNVVQTKLSRPLLEVSKANRDFARGTGDQAQVRARLAASERTIRTLGRRLAAVEPPAPARKLHRLLLRLVDSEADLAGEVARLADFIPAFSAALAPVAPAGRTLKAELGAKATLDRKADALDAYDAALGEVMARLDGLRPPPSSVPVYRSQLQTLQRVRTAVRKLSAALRERRSAEIAPLLHEFDLAAVANQSTAAQKAQIRAVRAYNARVGALDRLTAAIARERARLQRST